MNEKDNPSSTISINRYSGKEVQTVSDVVAVEEPLEIRLGYTDPHKGRLHKSLSITMRTPGDDINLACGFLYGESIIKTIEDIESISDRMMVRKMKGVPKTNYIIFHAPHADRPDTEKDEF